MGNTFPEMHGRERSVAHAVEVSDERLRFVLDCLKARLRRNAGRTISSWMAGRSRNCSAQHSVTSSEDLTANMQTALR